MKVDALIGCSNLQLSVKYFRSRLFRQIWLFWQMCSHVHWQESSCHKYLNTQRIVFFQRKESRTKRIAAQNDWGIFFFFNFYTTADKATTTCLFSNGNVRAKMWAIPAIQILAFQSLSSEMRLKLACKAPLFPSVERPWALEWERLLASVKQDT